MKDSKRIYNHSYTFRARLSLHKHTTVIRIGVSALLYYGFRGSYKGLNIPLIYILIVVVAVVPCWVLSDLELILPSFANFIILLLIYKGVLTWFVIIEFRVADTPEVTKIARPWKIYFLTGI